MGALMIQHKRDENKSLVGFFPIFYSLGETIPLVKIAQSYMERGGKAVFFSHGGIFEHMAEDIGCEVIRLHDWWVENPEKGDKLWAKGARDETLFLNQYDKEYIKKSIEEEIQVFKKNWCERSGEYLEFNV
jgi:hypothetical protein